MGWRGPLRSVEDAEDLGPAICSGAGTGDSQPGGGGRRLESGVIADEDELAEVERQGRRQLNGIEGSKPRSLYFDGPGPGLTIELDQGDFFQDPSCCLPPPVPGYPRGGARHLDLGDLRGEHPLGVAEKAPKFLPFGLLDRKLDQRRRIGVDDQTLSSRSS